MYYQINYFLYQVLNQLRRLQKFKFNYIE